MINHCPRPSLYVPPSIRPWIPPPYPRPSLQSSYRRQPVVDHLRQSILTEDERRLTTINIHNLLYKLEGHTKVAEGHWRKAVLQRVTIETSEMMDEVEGSWYVSDSPQY